ncbi:MAG TPA: hypothetical protein VE379_09995 [Vicinamibacterales bacterium]|nr:hypothetical protein [Vicinamibacterales bacterium]
MRIFVLQGVHAERVVLGERRDLDRLVEPAQAPRIDRIEAHVRPPGLGHRLLHLVQDVRRVPVLDRVRDVVVDAFAEEDHRLPPAADTGHEFRDALQRAERRSGLVGALHRERIGRTRHPRHRARQLVQFLERRGAQLLTHEAVDRPDEQAPAGREVLRRRLRAAGRDHRREIVGAEVSLHELPGGRTEPRSARRVRVQVVEHQHEHAAIELTPVGSDVGFDGSGGKDWGVNLLYGDVYQGEHRDGLGLRALQHLEVLLRQTAHEVTLRVGDGGIDLDVVDLDLERDRRLPLGGRRGGGRRLLGLQCGQRQGATEGGKKRTRADHGRLVWHRRLIVSRSRHGARANILKDLILRRLSPNLCGPAVVLVIVRAGILG